MNKTDFKPFAVGTVFNPVKKDIRVSNPICTKIVLLYPSRLNAMALDPSAIAENKNLQYAPGEIIFKVKIYTKVAIEILASQDGIEVSETSARPSLVRHAALLMREALGFKDGLRISAVNKTDIRHAGLGSSSGLIAAVASAINELYGKPINRSDLVQYLAQNHGEEIKDDSTRLSPVQCIGGSAAAGQYKGGLLILAGQSRVVGSMEIQRNREVVIGIPKDFRQLDAKTLLEREILSFPKFIECGKKYRKTIAFRVLHEVLPGLKENSISPVGDLVYEYRFKMGSIDNCSYCYENLPAIAKGISFLKEDDIVNVLALSSVGPAFFAIGGNTKQAAEVFESSGLRVINTEIENDTYKIEKIR